MALKEKIKKFIKMFSFDNGEDYSGVDFFNNYNRFGP